MAQQSGRTTLDQRPESRGRRSVKVTVTETVTEFSSQGSSLRNKVLSQAAFLVVSGPRFSAPTLVLVNTLEIFFNF